MKNRQSGNKYKNHDDDTIWLPSSLLLDLEYIFAREELSREISSYLSIDDLLSLSKTNSFFHSGSLLDGSDPHGIWKNIEDTILKGSLRPKWVKDAKTHALAVTRAKRFAQRSTKTKRCGCTQEVQEQEKETPQEMGQNLAGEFFGINDQLNDDGTKKAGYDLFVQITTRRRTSRPPAEEQQEDSATNDNAADTKERQDQSKEEEELEEAPIVVLYQGFPSYHTVARTEGGVVASSRHPRYGRELMLYVPSFEFEKFDEYPKLLTSLNLQTGGVARGAHFVDAIDIVITAAHKDRPHRLIRATCGTISTDVWLCSSYKRGNVSYSLFPTKQCSSCSPTSNNNNDMFYLHDEGGIPYNLRCQFGIAYRPAMINDDGTTRGRDSGKISVKPCISLAFRQVVDWESLLWTALTEYAEFYESTAMDEDIPLAA